MPSSKNDNAPALADTIAAIATPLGEGGIAMIRLSGPQALAIAGDCFRPVGKTSLAPADAPTHTLHFGKILRQGRVVDEVLLGVMRTPRTFTREDVVEITCHGGLLPAKLVLDAVLQSGARLAMPGEFTRRAFLNGRIDLAQAEAVADLIHSRTELAAAAAGEQLAVIERQGEGRGWESDIQRFYAKGWTCIVDESVRIVVGGVVIGGGDVYNGPGSWSGEADSIHH